MNTPVAIVEKFKNLIYRWDKIDLIQLTWIFHGNQVFDCSSQIQPQFSVLYMKFFGSNNILYRAYRIRVLALIWSAAIWAMNTLHFFYFIVINIE